MSHTDGKNRIPQGGDLNTLFGDVTTKSPKYNNLWKWVEYFNKSENTDTWGFSNIEIEYETI